MITTPIIIVFIVIGLPVICVTRLIGIKMQQNQQLHGTEGNERTSEMVETLVHAVRSLQDRVENLETIIQRTDRT
ncbi:MAG: hypothetical protein K9M84_04620 [Spirochaetia bacterium]|nr:hypothetical protein [Spirochaetia bacterium]